MVNYCNFHFVSNKRNRKRKICFIANEITNGIANEIANE